MQHFSSCWASQMLWHALTWIHKTVALHCSFRCRQVPPPSAPEQLTSQVLVCQGARLGRVGQVVGGALSIEGGSIRADTVLERCARLLHSMGRGTAPGSKDRTQDGGRQRLYTALLPSECDWRTCMTPVTG